MSYIYDKPISEEDLQQAASSLRLLKAKMKNKSEMNVNKEGDLLDSFAEKPSSQPSTQDSEYGFPAKRQYQGPLAEQNLNENNMNQGAGNKNYRKIFKPNLKSEDQQDSLTSHMESRKENLSRQSNVKRNVEEENPFGSAGQVIPSRISKKTLGGSNKFSRESERATGAKRAKPEQPITDDIEEGAEDFYKPSQKQQYKPLEENVYNPSKYDIEKGFNDEEDTPKNLLKVPSRGAPVRNSLTVGDPDERALKNSRADVFHDGMNERPEEEKAMVRCPAGCGRQFFEDVIEKHANACGKVFQSKRKQFDISKQRMTEDQQKTIVTKPVTRLGQSLAQKNKGKDVIKGVAKWKRDSEAFRAAMKASRGEELTWQEKVAVAKSEESNFIQCEFCSRKFSEKAAEKHVPFCQSKARKEALKRPNAGVGAGAGAAKGRVLKKY